MDTPESVHRQPHQKSCARPVGGGGGGAALQSMADVMSGFVDVFAKSESVAVTGSSVLQAASLHHLCIATRQ